jgi:hypothetical protein
MSLSRPRPIPETMNENKPNSHLRVIAINTIENEPGETFEVCVRL